MTDVQNEGDEGVKERISKVAGEYNEREGKSKDDMWEKFLGFLERPEVKAVAAVSDFIPTGYSLGDVWTLCKAVENVWKGVDQKDWGRVAKGVTEGVIAAVPELPGAPVAMALESLVPNEEDKKAEVNSTAQANG